MVIEINSNTPCLMVPRVTLEEMGKITDPSVRFVYAYDATDDTLDGFRRGMFYRKKDGVWNVVEREDLEKEGDNDV